MEGAKELPNEESRISDAIFSISLKLESCFPLHQRHLPCLLEKEYVYRIQHSHIQWMHTTVAIVLKTIWVVRTQKGRFSDVVKLAYLRDVLKDGLAYNAIDGLVQTTENYNEAVSCLQHRYDRPCLIHQAHIHAILNIPSLIDSGGYKCT